MKWLNNNRLSNSFGFTLMEMLLVVAMIGAMAALSMPIYQSSKINNDLHAARNIIAQTSRRAQILSQAVDGDSSWGLYVQVGSITLFQGDTYVGRNIDFDEVFEMPESTTPSGDQEIVFSKLHGALDSVKTITLTANTNKVSVVVVNEKGMIDY